jgi:hypothetical protein
MLEHRQSIVDQSNKFGASKIVVSIPGGHNELARRQQCRLIGIKTHASFDDAAQAGANTLALEAPSIGRYSGETGQDDEQVGGI